MAKTRRRRPANRAGKRRPSLNEATQRLAPLGVAAPTAAVPMNRPKSRRAQRQQMIRTGIIAGVAVGVIGAIVLVFGRGGSTTLKPTDVTGKVLSATVQQQAKGSAGYALLRDGAKLAADTSIKTDENGLGEFEYKDGSIMRVGPSSTATLNKMRTGGSKRDIANHLTTGKMWNHVQSRSGSGNHYQTAVLGANSEVTGTSYATECLVAETDCTYTVVAGHVRVTDSSGHTETLGPNDRIEVQFGRLGDVHQLSGDELAADSWIAQNMALDGTALSTTTSSEDTTTTITGETTTTIFGETTLIPVTGTTIRGTATTRPSSPGTTAPHATTTPTSPATTASTAPATTVTTAAGSTTSTTKKCPKHGTNTTRADCT
jgi:hypothetical protein